MNGGSAEPAVLDACVLVPLIAREALFTAAKAGWFAPRWSRRILEEWRAAATKTGAGGRATPAAFVDGDVALARAAFPDAEISGWEALEGPLDLPDWNDRHVLAAALAADASLIITDNLRDFPRRALSVHGVAAQSSDDALRRFAEARPAAARAGADALLDRLAAGGVDVVESARLGRYAVFKKARLPRFARALAGD